jgi:hypothetical protein
MFSLPNAMAEDSIPAAAKKKMFTAVIFAPLNLFDPYNPSFQLGIQREIAPDLVVQAEVGIIIPNNMFYYGSEKEEVNGGSTYSSTGWIDEHHEGWKFRAELRQIFIKRKSSTSNKELRVFGGVELFHTNSSGDYASGDNNENRFYQKMLKTGLNVKGGIQGIYGHFLLEAYGGLGFANYDIEHSNVVGSPSYPYLVKNLFREGKGWRWNLPFNGKIGFVF